MARSAEQQRGIDFEAEAAEALGLELVPGSGSQWHSRSDASGTIRLSCKSNTTKRTWGQTREQLREAQDLAQGTGEIPALAILDQDGEAMILMNLADAAQLFTEEAQAERRPLSRADVVRETARVPVLLRDD